MDKVDKISEFRHHRSLSKTYQKKKSIKVSAKMVVIIGLLPYLLINIFILKYIYYFRTCNPWTGFQRHIILALRKFDKSKNVSDKGCYLFLFGAIFVLNVLFSKFRN